MICLRQYMEIHNKIAYQHYNQVMHYIHDFILYTRNFLHKMKWKANIALWGVSMKINNENEKYTLYFIFHTNIYISNHQGSL